VHEEKTIPKKSSEVPNFFSKWNILKRWRKKEIFVWPEDYTVPQIFCPWLFSVFCISLQLIKEIFGDLYAETLILQSRKLFWSMKIMVFEHISLSIAT